MVVVERTCSTSSWPFGIRFKLLSCFSFSRAKQRDTKTHQKKKKVFHAANLHYHVRSFHSSEYRVECSYLALDLVKTLTRVCVFVCVRVLVHCK